MNTLQADSALRVISGIARKADFETLGLDNVRSIKSDGEHPQYRPSAVAAVKDVSDPEERTFTWQGSTEDVDSMGDVLKVSGWDLRRVKTGIAPLLLGHDSYPLPAGILQRASKSGKTDGGVRALDITARIHEQEIFGESEFGMWVEGARKLVANGTMKGSSVGFVPMAGAMRWPEEKEREELGMPPWGMIFEGQELLELSMTPIPANRNASRKKEMRAALKEMVADGQLSDEAAEILAEDLSLSQEAWLRRVQSVNKLIVPITRTLPWVKGAKAEEKPATDPKEIASTVEKIVDDAVARISKAVITQVRRELSPVSREILEPLEVAITNAADELEDAAKRLGIGREDSERAEVSRTSAANATSASTAESTGTSRDNPTTPTESKAGDLLLKVLDPTYVGVDTAHGSPDRSDQAAGVQE